ncbi:N-acetylgalactosamine kinase [Microplitis demolitor]|uniref:N-acetylgalactosamine kinase n=1 Tax=Microplitis demolitor TaxID=69319 RepID=UPI0004CC9C4E|nr:N-acetylgalactosamine kinase [Microplitis demolitor]
MNKSADMEPVEISKPDDMLSNRLDKLTKHFVSRFNYKPQFFTRVPGRVNLIGDHVDYCGYPVCPMAIEQDVLLAVGKSNSTGLHLTNVESDKYPDYDCDSLSDCGDVLKKTKEPRWYKYFICGVVGALEEITGDRSQGIDVAVWGNIPPASGLSSSSAVVSSAVLAMTHAFDCPMSKKNLALLSARAERHIGTQGGAMDQAIAFLANSGAAKLIEFNPLRTTDVRLPEDAVFVIANSMAEFNKAATAEFNTRVRECKSAAQIIAKEKLEKWDNVKTIGDLQKELGTSLSETLEIAKKILVDYPTLFKRIQHVLSEADRVLEFKSVCQSSKDGQLIRLGKLMNESHQSLRDLYECSHKSVDLLVEMALECGALGARITGAGWGGCAVALTTKDKVESFVKDLKQKFIAINGAKADQVENAIFVTEPRAGAAIYETRM